MNFQDSGRGLAKGEGLLDFQDSVGGFERGEENNSGGGVETPVGAMRIRAIHKRRPQNFGHFVSRFPDPFQRLHVFEE